MLPHDIINSALRFDQTTPKHPTDPPPLPSPLVVLFNIPPPSLPTPIFNRIIHPIGCIIFVLNSLKQHKAHLALSLQSRTPSIPYPPLPKTSEFKIHSCPHYVAELYIYIAFLAFHQTGGSAACAAWVHVNLMMAKMGKDEAKGKTGGLLFGGGWGEGEGRKKPPTKTG